MAGRVPELSPELREAVLQEAARRAFRFFVHYTMPDYQAARFHLELMEALDWFLAEVIARRSPRLLIEAPPRHGKSELVSRRFPAYVFGRYPDLSIIGASYAADLAGRMNRDVQRIIDDERYQAVYPDTQLFGKNIRTVAKGSYLRNSEIFEIVGHKGTYRAAGVGQGITGMGADILDIDDPVKDMAEAMSKAKRAAVWDWYTSTAYTRLSPGGGVLLTLTRWHHDDLAGRLLKAAQEGGDQWRRIRFPAIATEDEPHRKKGEALDPNRYPLERLEKIKAAVGARVWGSLYQQNPSPEEGNLFRREWFEIVPAAPAKARRVRYWDRAATEGGGDWTVGARVARDSDGVFYIEDVIRMQASPLKVKQSIRNAATQDGKLVRVRLEQEPGASGKSEVEDLIRALSGYMASADRPTGDKALRAMPFSAQAEAGNVKLVRGTWNTDFLDELEQFPNGEHDDQVDAASGAFNDLTDSGTDYKGMLQW